MKFVKPEADMDDETFVKHFNARHTPFAEMEHIIAKAPAVILNMRAYHRRIHRLGLEEGRTPNHTHRGDIAE